MSEHPVSCPGRPGVQELGDELERVYEKWVNDGVVATTPVRALAQAALDFIYRTPEHRVAEVEDGHAETLRRLEKCGERCIRAEARVAELEAKCEAAEKARTP